MHRLLGNGKNIPARSAAQCNAVVLYEVSLANNLTEFVFRFIYFLDFFRQKTVKNCMRRMGKKEKKKKKKAQDLLSSSKASHPYIYVYVNK